jgi:hypothetical protein
MDVSAFYIYLGNVSKNFGANIKKTSYFTICEKVKYTDNYHMYLSCKKSYLFYSFIYK